MKSNGRFPQGKRPFFWLETNIEGDKWKYVGCHSRIKARGTHLCGSDGRGAALQAQGCTQLVGYGTPGRNDPKASRAHKAALGTKGIALKKLKKLLKSFSEAG